MTTKTIKTRWGETSPGWILVILGIVALAIGCLLIFYWKEGIPAAGTYELKTEHNRKSASVEGYLQRGDTVECNFTISGGNERANFTIKSPYGLVVDNMSAESPYPHLHNYTAKHSGRHIFVFEDSENVTKFVRADFSSPLQPPHYLSGVLIVFGSIVILFFGMCGLWSHYRYGSKELESVRIDPAKFRFSELLISNKYIGIGRDEVVVPLLGRFRYWMLCILFGISLYIVGGISAVWSDTVVPDSTRNLTKGFGTDFYFLTLSIVTGLASLFALRALRGLGDKLVYTDRHLADSLDTKARGAHNRENETISGELDLEELEENARKNTWLRSGKLWYWVSFIGFGGIGTFVGWWTATHNSTVWIGLPLSASWWFCIFGCGVIGATVGALIFVSVKGITILCFYCKTHVLARNISDPMGERDRIGIGYSPDRLGGLKRIGEFSFELDFAAAIPSFAFLASYASGTELYGLSSLICLFAYTFILAGILFLPLYPFHVKMASAKECALANINKRFCDAYLGIEKSIGVDWKRVRKLKDIYLLQERIARKPVWPFPRWDLKLFATLSMPVLLSVLSDYISKHFGLI